MSELSYDVTLFISHVLKSLPFLLWGIIVSSGLLAFVDEHQFVAKLPQNRILGAIVGSSLGIMIPVGQYGNIPVTRRLLLQGASIPLSISFLIASPTINPFVIWVSWRVLGNYPRLLFLRILGAWLIGIILGLIFSAYADKPSVKSANLSPLAMYSTLLHSGTLLRSRNTPQTLHRTGSLIYDYQANSAIPNHLWGRCLLFLDNLIKEFLELGSILLLGCAITTVAQVFLPQAQLLTWGQTPVTQILVMSLFSLVLSFNSLWTPYFINPLTNNFLYGSNLVFLLLSSLINLKSLSLLFTTIRPKAAIYILILTAQLMILLCFILNFYLS
ncbi:MAG: permease [cyanobacterium endosymbiont of Rhopalodia musculus]|uniref:permease n=1 Tax=cyanobacterium endosymbiont of Epithemia clementina EcSB TaxID=3034674 RepID=UPI0024806C82|nr:permease [cyanobacterium endosymbiont of Epithemia clementina EcSB]WGT66975.1 permease [cyanobacterium endosymbiont of Epithemia clementina EcSB]